MKLGDVAKIIGEHWPWPTGRAGVVADYATLGTLKHALADIALRNHVMADAPAGNEYELAICEGRRRAALEIIKLAGVGYNELWAMIEKKPSNGERR